MVFFLWNSFDASHSLISKKQKRLGPVVCVCVRAFAADGAGDADVALLRGAAQREPAARRPGGRAYPPTDFLSTFSESELAAMISRESSVSEASWKRAATRALSLERDRDQRPTPPRVPHSVSTFDTELYKVSIEYP